MKKIIMLLILSIFLVSCSDNEQEEINQENINIEVTKNKEKSDSKEVKINEEKVVENKKYKCDIKIKNIP
jgi:PBP1b-binding outer membrane lipoprotein LpoB